MSSAKVVIVIPTYNERENATRMIAALADIVPHIPRHQVEVLFVDDSSPDGTADVVNEAATKYSWLHLLGGAPKQGLGVAYARGMQYAMAKLGADFLMEFDADFQHPPADIPRLIAEIDHGYDYIIGSRYVPGGSVPAAWGIDRKAISFFGNLIARVGLLLPQIHDCTGGFKLSRVQGFMDRFDFSTLISKKFAYKIHLLAYMANAGAKIKEVPFHFDARTAGGSKYMSNEIQESLRVIWVYQTRYNPALRRLFRFAVVGGVGFIVNILGARFFKQALPSTWSMATINGVANAAASELAIISNFTWNNLWTFTDQKITGLTPLLQKFAAFNFSSLVTGIIIPSIVVFLLTRAFGDHLFIYQVIAIFGLTIPLNWFVYNRLIWKPTKKATS